MMRKTLLAAMLSAAAFAPVSGQQAESAPKPVRANDRALDFFFNGGGGIGIRFWNSPSSAWNVNLSGSGSYRSASNEPLNSGTRTSRSLGLALGAGYEWHTPYTNDMSSFWQINTALAYSYSEPSYLGPDIAPVPVMYDTRYGIGAGVGFGLEYWLTPRLSVRGIYGISVSSSRTVRTLKYLDGRETESGSTDINLSLNQLSFGVGMYF